MHANVQVSVGALGKKKIGRLLYNSFQVGFYFWIHSTSPRAPVSLNWVNIGLYNGSLPGRQQAIILRKYDILSGTQKGVDEIG